MALANLNKFLVMCQPWNMTNRGRPPLLSDDEILDKAFLMFAKSGYDAMSVRALNAELGLSHETVSKRFGPKSELFLTAVRREAALFIIDFNDEIARCAPADDLARLRATLRAFMVASSRHPALGDLLHHDSIAEEQRMVIIGQTGLAERIVETAALLNRLHHDGLIRDMQIRELWFLAHGAVAPLHFPSLAHMFDVFDGPVNPDDVINRMSDAIMRSLLV